VLATAVAALDRPDVVALRDAIAVGDGPSTVIGRLTGLPAPLAGFVNAIPIAREQLQDGHRRARGHPASHVVPAVLAVAESREASGVATLSAILAGYETGVRIGLAMEGTPEGVHDIATWAALGGAAGVAHLLSNGDAATIAAAIDSAAALPVTPDATTVFAGYTAQDLYLPTGVQAAILHGQAAAAGIGAAPGTLERHFAARTAADPAGFAARLGLLLAAPETPEDWMILGGYLKRHPTCALLHGVNDAVEDLIEAHGIQGAGQVGDVRVVTYAAAAVFADPMPSSDMAARFSIPWTVAAALTHGRLDDSAFTDEALGDQRLRDLARRVQVAHDPRLDAGYPAGRPAVVTITFADGRTVQASRHAPPRGDGPAALDDPVVATKAAGLLARAAGAEWGDAVLAAVAGLETEGLAQLSRLLRHVGSVGHARSVRAQFR
jgi:2-methylcitrate dehydratase PrpD